MAEVEEFDLQALYLVVARDFATLYNALSKSVLQQTLHSERDAISHRILCHLNRMFVHCVYHINSKLRRYGTVSPQTLQNFCFKELRRIQKAIISLHSETGLMDEGQVWMSSSYPLCEVDIDIYYETLQQFWHYPPRPHIAVEEWAFQVLPNNTGRLDTAIYYSCMNLYEEHLHGDARQKIMQVVQWTKFSPDNLRRHPEYVLEQNYFHRDHLDVICHKLKLNIIFIDNETRAASWHRTPDLNWPWIVIYRTDALHRAKYWPALPDPDRSYRNEQLMHGRTQNQYAALMQQFRLFGYPNNLPPTLGRPTLDMDGSSLLDLDQAYQEVEVRLTNLQLRVMEAMKSTVELKDVKLTGFAFFDSSLEMSKEEYSQIERQQTAAMLQGYNVLSVRLQPSAARTLAIGCPFTPVRDPELADLIAKTCPWNLVQQTCPREACPYYHICAGFMKRVNRLAVYKAKTWSQECEVDGLLHDGKVHVLPNCRSMIQFDKRTDDHSIPTITQNCKHNQLPQRGCWFGHDHPRIRHNALKKMYYEENYKARYGQYPEPRLFFV